jgi:3-oxoacyl-[acyl-carrier protein] reductase
VRDAPDIAPDIALVTGGGSGLGEAIVRGLHGAGYRVAVTDIDGDKAQAVARTLDPAGETAIGLPLDVTDAAAIESATAQIEARWGAVQVLVNNAVLTRAVPVLDITLDDWDQVMAVNARGTFAASQILARRMKAAGYGRIVNMASLAGQNGGTATGAHYAASKGAIITLTKVFARDLAPFGITVNAIAPGPIDSPMVRALVPADKMAGMVAGIPVGRLGDAAFIADMVVRLAARDACFVTGATWDINGGLFMR